MTSKRPLLLGLSSGAAALVLGACSPERAQGPMNLLFVSIDTLRADHVSCYGYERPTTPEIDALAADGHRFSSAHTVMATTLPAHLSMFTSLFPAQTGVLANGFRVPPGVETLAERLAAAGFQTGGFVSSIPLDPQVQIQQGFDEYVGPDGLLREGAETAELAMRWIESTRREEPFFCFVHMFDPHTWYEVDDAAFAEPFGAPVGRELPPDRGRLKAALGDEARRDSIATYDAEIRYSDAQVGALLRFLEERGQRENTIVVVVSDHGESLDERHDELYAFDHGEYLSRHELRVPLVLWLPHAYAERGPAVHDDLVTVLDLMPTLLDLLGLPCDPPVIGRSLTGLLAGDALPARIHVAQRRVLGRSDRKHLEGREFSVFDGRYHWITSQSREDALFDTEADPLEEVNVIERHPERVAELRAALLDWKTLVDQPLWESDGEMSPELAKMLKALGYMGGEDAQDD